MARHPDLTLIPDRFSHVGEQTRARAARVRLMLFDVDGVLTSGTLLYGQDGEQLKSFNVLDGMGIRLLQKAGIETAIITARQSLMIDARARDLGITHVYKGVHDKAEALADLLARTHTSLEQTGCIGDDIIDLPILVRAGFAASVPNGHPEVWRHVDYVTAAAGGNGAVREVCDLILQAQGAYGSLYQHYLAPSPHFGNDQDRPDIAGTIS